MPPSSISLLARISEFDVVEVHNPLTSSFTATVAHSVVDRSPKPAQGEEHLKRVYGISLNSRKPALRHVKQQIVIPSGKSLRMMGDSARVVVMQLIKRMMMLEGKKKQMSDPGLRLEYEKRVILNSERYADNEPILSVEERLQKQLDELNKPEGVQESKEVQNEPAFAGFNQGNGQDSQSGTENSGGKTAKPQPGTGAHYQPAQSAEGKSESSRPNSAKSAGNTNSRAERPA